MPLALVSAACLLHGPCRCPELAEPLWASGGRYINIMLSFKLQPLKGWEWGSTVHMWGGWWTHMDPIAVLIMLGSGEKSQGMDGWMAGWAPLPVHLCPGCFWSSCKQKGAQAQPVPQFASTAVVFGQGGGMYGRLVCQDDGNSRSNCCTEPNVLWLNWCASYLGEALWGWYPLSDNNHVTRCLSGLWVKFVFQLSSTLSWGQLLQYVYVCTHTHTLTHRAGSKVEIPKRTKHVNAYQLGKRNPVQVVLIIKRFDAVPYTQQKKDPHYLNSLFGLVWLVSMNQSVICNSGGCCRKGFFRDVCVTCFRYLL